MELSTIQKLASNPPPARNPDRLVSYSDAIRRIRTATRILGEQMPSVSRYVSEFRVQVEDWENRAALKTAAPVAAPPTVAAIPTPAQTAASDTPLTDQYNALPDRKSRVAFASENHHALNVEAQRTALAMAKSKVRWFGAKSKLK